MIKLATICENEPSEERLLNCLRGEADLTITGSIVIQRTLQEADRGLAFLNNMLNSQPEIVLLDMELLREVAARCMPMLAGYTKKCTSTRAIIMGERFHEENVIAMMKAGARGFLLREQLVSSIGKCIRVVARGEIWLSGDLIGRVCDELVRDSQKQLMLKSPDRNQLDKMKTISRREMEILALVSESMTNEEIAQKLFLSTKTVKTHIRNIYEKTDMRNRVEAALLYTRYNQEVSN